MTDCAKLAFGWGESRATAACCTAASQQPYSAGIAATGSSAIVPSSSVRRASAEPDDLLGRCRLQDRYRGQRFSFVEHERRQVHQVSHLFGAALRPL